jgi:hypothetical protein
MLLGICKQVAHQREWLCPFVASSQVQTSKSENKKYSMKFSKKKRIHSIKTVQNFIYKHTTDSKNVQSTRKKGYYYFAKGYYFATSYDGDQCNYLLSTLGYL